MREEIKGCVRNAKGVGAKKKIGMVCDKLIDMKMNNSATAQQRSGGKRKQGAGK